MKPPGIELAILRASRAAHIPADARLRAWARAALARPAVVTLRYVAQAKGRRLNREFRGKDYATNVLTFIYDADPGAAPAGDIVICAPVVAREAREQGKEVRAHHAHLVVHGLLHLQGFDHEVDALEIARSHSRKEREKVEGPKPVVETAHH